MGHESKKITVVLSGPKHLLKSPLKKRTSGRISFRQFLMGHVEPGTLVGYRVTRTCAGNPKEAVCLDMKIKRFIDQKYTKEVKIYRARLIRPYTKSSRSGSGGMPEPEVITLEDDNLEYFPEVIPDPVAGEEDVVGVDMGTLNTKEEREAEVVAEDGNVTSASAEDVGADVNVSGPLGDEQRPCSSEQTAQEARTPAPPQFDTIKKESIVKSEWVEPPESTVAGLRARGVRIEDLETQTRQKIKIFSNPFLLVVREEVRKLRGDSYGWQSFVGKAPRCAYLIQELFK